MITTKHLQWEALMSNVDPLLEEGYHLTISRITVTDFEVNDWTYRVTVTDDDGQVIAEAEGYPLTEAMSGAFEMTPERESNQ